MIQLLFHAMTISTVCREDSDKVSTQILVATIMSLYKKSPNLTTQFFFEKLLSPFQNFYAECRRTDSNDVSVLDKGGFKCLFRFFTNMYRL